MPLSAAEITRILARESFLLRWHIFITFVIHIPYREEGNLLRVLIFFIMVEKHLKSVIAKKFSIPRRQQKIIFTIALILIAFNTILSTFTLSISDIVTIRTKSKTKLNELNSDERFFQESAAGIHQQLEEEIIYKKRNQKIREVCKKVKTTRPVFVNNRKKKLSVSYWFKNRTNNCSLGKYNLCNFNLYLNL